MATIKEMIRKAEGEGYQDENAEAKVCQDIILKALSESPLSRNVTIKGGVVMRSLSGDARRATQDIDIDFIRYSLADDSIRTFIGKLDCLADISIEMTGIITELKQQDYHGKRVFVRLIDESGDSIEGKIDLGVHNNLSIEQEEYCFDIAFYDEGATLLINSKEQMFTEKLRSLLKFGPNSTRFKDVFDLYYLTGIVDRERLIECFQALIFEDKGMRENDMDDIRRRVGNTFSSSQYVSRLSLSRKNWLGMGIPVVINGLLAFLKSI